MASGVGAGLVDFDVAGAGVGLERCASAVDRRGHVMVIAGVAADADGAGTCGGVDAEVGVLADVGPDGTGTGLQARGTSEGAVGFDITGTCAGGQGAVDTVDADGPGAGGGMDFSGSQLLKLNVAGAGA